MLSGCYTTTSLRHIQYGPSSITHLPSLLRQFLTPPFSPPNEASTPKIRVMIVTGKSLSEKTPLVKDLEEMLKKEEIYGVTFSGIGEHAPVKDIRRAVQIVKDEKITVLVSLGGGSPIDAAKAIAYFHREEAQALSFLPHVAIPTTLSVAETGCKPTYTSRDFSFDYLSNAGYTDEEGNKVGVTHPLNSPFILIYDPLLLHHTPTSLLLSTGLRALDHAVENLYREGVPMGLRVMARGAVGGLMEGLRGLKGLEKEGDVGFEEKRTEVLNGLLLNAWQSLWPISRTGSLGLSHSIGHRIGAKYSIPHGFCSCLTLAPTVRLMSQTLKGENLKSLAQAVTFLPDSDTNRRSFDYSSEKGQREACLYLSEQINLLVSDLGLKRSLSGYKVPSEDLDEIANFVMSHAPEGDRVVGKYDFAGVRGILEGIY